ANQDALREALATLNNQSITTQGLLNGLAGVIDPISPDTTQAGIAATVLGSLAKAALGDSSTVPPALTKKLKDQAEAARAVLEILVGKYTDADPLSKKGKLTEALEALKDLGKLISPDLTVQTEAITRVTRALKDLDLQIAAQKTAEEAKKQPAQPKPVAPAPAPKPATAAPHDPHKAFAVVLGELEAYQAVYNVIEKCCKRGFDISMSASYGSGGEPRQVILDTFKELKEKSPKEFEELQNLVLSGENLMSAVNPRLNSDLYDMFMRPCFAEVRVRDVNPVSRKVGYAAQIVAQRPVKNSNSPLVTTNGSNPRGGDRGVM
ncbi:MAG: soluble cytochrome b562, partial [Rickettsiales bacterium]